MRAAEQQVWGNQRILQVTAAGAVADGRHGECVRISFDFPRVMVITAETRGLDRLAGDTGQLELEFTIGAGLAADTFIVPSPNYLGGFFILAASSVAIVARMSGVNVTGPRTLLWNAFAAPWGWAGPETMVADGMPLTNLTRGRNPQTGEQQ